MSNKPDSFMPLYTGDWLRSVSHMTPAERDAYMLLTIHYWDTGKPLVYDDARLARICMISPAEWKTVKATVTERFTVTVTDTGTVLVKNRIEEELEKARAKYASRKSASETANRAKAAKNAKKASKVGHRDGDRHADRDASQPQPHSFLPSERKEGGVPPAQTNSAGETPPGWETKYPKTWQQVRNEVGDLVWGVWFSNLTPASEREIVCTTPFQVSEVPHRYEKILVKHGLDDARFVLEKKPTGSPGRAVNGLAATSGAE